MNHRTHIICLEDLNSIDLRVGEDYLVGAYIDIKWQNFCLFQEMFQLMKSTLIFFFFF